MRSQKGFRSLHDSSLGQLFRGNPGKLGDTDIGNCRTLQLNLTIHLQVLRVQALGVAFIEEPRSEIVENETEKIVQTDSLR